MPGGGSRARFDVSRMMRVLPCMNDRSDMSNGHPGQTRITAISKELLMDYCTKVGDIQKSLAIMQIESKRNEILTNGCGCSECIDNIIPLSIVDLSFNK
jgi:hypothetical protein